MSKKNTAKVSLTSRIDCFLFKWIINWVYPQYYRPKYGYIKYYKLFLQYVIPQKILRINGNVPWPVHFTSKIINANKISKGIICDPGDSIGIYIQANNGIEFGNNVELSPGVVIVSSNHEKNDFTKNDFHRPIKIGNNVIIYANSVILPGVHIGDNVLIGAGSIVTKDIPSNSIAVGNPCQVIKIKPPYKKDFKNIKLNR
jgi:acetyltransferase-like isoleucine patch superfamily enzyme